MKVKNRSGEMIEVKEENPLDIVGEGYHLMTHAQAITMYVDAEREAEEIKTNMEGVEDIKIARFEGFYDIYVKQKQGEAA